jgi:hypothetical protein
MSVGIGTGIGFPDKPANGQPGTAAPHITGVVFDKAVTGGNQYKMQYSDGTEYTFVVPEQDVDFSHLAEGSIPAFRKVQGMLVDSGVKVNGQSIDFGADTLSFGSHTMKALGENVGFTNKVTGVTYVPLWQEYGSNKSTGYIRAIGSKESVTRQADTSEVIINPDFKTQINNDEMVHQIRVSFNEATPGGIEALIYANNSPLVHVEAKQDMPRGRQTISFSPGFDLKKDIEYRVVIRRLDGQDLKLKGKSGFPFLQVVRSTWVDLVVADQKWVEQHFVSIQDFNKVQTALTDAQALLKQLQTAQGGMQGDQATQKNELGALEKRVDGKLWTIPDIVAQLKKLGYRPAANTGGPNTPTSQTSAYALFQADATSPPTLPPGLPVYRGGRVQLHKDTDTPEYAFIFLPPGEGGKVEKVSESGGLASIWAKESKVYDGKTYTVLRSPYPFVEHDLTLFLHE